MEVVEEVLVFCFHVCSSEDKVKFMPSIVTVAGRTVRQLENSGHDSLLESLSNITVTIARP